LTSNEPNLTLMIPWGRQGTSDLVLVLILVESFSMGGGGGAVGAGEDRIGGHARGHGGGVFAASSAPPPAPGPVPCRPIRGWIRGTNEQTDLVRGLLCVGAKSAREGYEAAEVSGYPSVLGTAEMRQPRCPCSLPLLASCHRRGSRSYDAPSCLTLHQVQVQVQGRGLNTRPSALFPLDWAGLGCGAARRRADAGCILHMDEPPPPPATPTQTPAQASCAGHMSTRMDAPKDTEGHGTEEKCTERARQQAAGSRQRRVVGLSDSPLTALRTPRALCTHRRLRLRLRPRPPQRLRPPPSPFSAIEPISPLTTHALRLPLDLFSTTSPAKPSILARNHIGPPARLLGGGCPRPPNYKR
jgi:hypothetical protein